MKKWLNSISSEILLGYAAILISTLLTAFPLINTNHEVKGQLDTFVQKTLPELESIRTISGDLKQLELNAYSLYGLTLSSEAFENQFVRSMASIRRDLAEISDDDPELSQALDAFAAQLQAIHTTMTRASIDWDQARLDLSALSSSSSAITQHIDQHIHMLATSAQKNSNAIIEKISLAGTLLFGLILVIGAVAVLAYFHSRKEIAQPIMALSSAANRITEGDFNTAITINKHDEIGNLASTFNHMQHGIKKREERIIRHAHYDDLTGLARSGLMTNRLNAAIEQADKNNSSLCLVLIDLLRFKDINNAFGHAHGDAVLKEVATRMLNYVQNPDQLARTNGDKFLLLLENTEELASASYTAKLIKQLTQTIEIDDTSLRLSVCSGIVSYPNHGTDASDLLRLADVAMNQARTSLSDVAIFQHGNDQSHLRQLTIIRDLRSAIETDQLMLFYQPKIDAKTHKLIGAEALIRWIHPELGFMPPDEFIPIAERSGNVGLITDWVLRKAIEQGKLWHESGLPIKMSVNLSAIDLLNPDLPKLIIGLLEQHQLAPSQLVLEITESTVLRDTDLALSLLNQLREAGINLSIDDYGTDFSSLAKLRELPVQELKIDKSFVMNMASNDNDTVIVKSTIDLGHNMGLRITAEGVEDQTTLDLLHDLGCDEIQGYFISKPLSIQDFSRWVETYQSSPQEADLEASF